MKKYIILGEEDSHEYTLKVNETDNGTIYTLYASNNGKWSENFRNTKVLRLIDNGNCVRFDRMSLELDYSGISEMKLLLDCYSKIDTNLMEKYKVYEVKKL